MEKEGIREGLSHPLSDGHYCSSIAYTSNPVTHLAQNAEWVAEGMQCLRELYHRTK